MKRELWGKKIQEKLNFIQSDIITVNLPIVAPSLVKIQEISLTEKTCFFQRPPHAICICLSSY